MVNNIQGLQNKPSNNRIYSYPKKYIRKDGKLMKNRKRQIQTWRYDIKKNYLNIDKYTELKLENKILKDNIIDYQIALEIWVLIAQSQN
tara:strand:+ start:6589 stop:6855 length:267 start_codon:yes stop_codon:yes gene_type:complete